MTKKDDGPKKATDELVAELKVDIEEVEDERSSSGLTSSPRIKTPRLGQPKYHSIWDDSKPCQLQQGIHSPVNLWIKTQQTNGHEG